jgi:uncharacterized protein (TIGR02996 family)
MPSAVPFPPKTRAMADHDTFLRAILAAPFDDAPRLVYADWLEESARTARAAFIRVQCALAAGRSGAAVNPGVRDALHRQQAVIVSGHLLRWDREFATAAGLGRVPDGYWDWGWDRGFIDDFVCSARDWMVVGATVRKLQPVRLVKLTHWITRLADLCRSSTVADLNILRLVEDRHNARGAAVVADVADGNLCRVGRLELDMPVSPEVAARIRDRLPGVHIALRSEFR